MKIARFIAGLAAAFALVCGTASAQEGRWLRAESTHFVFYSDLGERTVRQSITELERFDTWLRFLLGTRAPAPDNKLDIYVFAGERGLSEVWPGVPNTVRGFYQATPEQTAAFALYHTGGFSDQTVLFHEYAHHFMLQYFAGAYPKWFVEGFAEFVSTTTFDGDEVWTGIVNADRFRQLDQDSWVPLDRMLRGELHGGMDVFRFYAQSWLMTHYIVLNHDKKAAFGRYVEALRGGADPVEAFQPAFGETLDQFENELRHYLRVAERHGVPFPQAAAIEVSVTAMPRAADDLLPMLARLRRPPVKPEDRTELGNDALAAAAHYPDDPTGQRVHAWGLLLTGDRSGARAILEPLVAAHPDDVEALYLLGKSYLDEANAGPPDAALATAARGRPYLVRGFHLNPHHAATLFAYAQIFGHPLNPQVLDVLLEAHDLAPQVDEISVYAGIALMEAQRFPEAVPMLASVAYSPHAGRLAKRALHLLEAARQNQPPPPPSPDDDKEDDE